MKQYYQGLQLVYQNRLKSRSWLVGPRAGLNTNWLFGEGFRAYGDMAASLVYQYYKSITMQRTDTTDTSLLGYNYANKIGYVTPVFELGLGLGWGTYFDCNNWHFDLILGYDFQYYWNQNMMRDLRDKVDTTCGFSPGDLMLHGLTITARFDF